MAVADWPSYLLRGIPPRLRAAMTVHAEDNDISLADVVRQALCRRYQLDCDPASFGYQAGLDTNGDALLIRIQPDVWDAMKHETESMDGATKKLILESLNDYLEVTTQ